jgi:rRNA maturation endonuclease Nob1
MNSRTQSTSVELMQQVKTILHHNPKISIRCTTCDSIFPKDYKKCPNCQTYQT